VLYFYAGHCETSLQPVNNHCIADYSRRGFCGCLHFLVFYVQNCAQKSKKIDATATAAIPCLSESYPYRRHFRQTSNQDNPDSFFRWWGIRRTFIAANDPAAVMYSEENGVVYYVAKGYRTQDALLEPV